jgi:gluconate 5-dehydrogenase
MDVSPFSLENKKALVTGGNTGIGFGIAQGLVRAGATVAICGRDKLKSHHSLDILNKMQPGCKSFIFNLENSAEIPDFYEHVSDTMDGIDILINNAGIQSRARADQIMLEDFNRLIKVNLTAPYVLSQCFARAHIKTNKSGNIIMIASLMSEAARKTTSPYTTAKGGIKQLIKALAIDWAEFNIRVNGIGPGYIQTEMTRSLYEDKNFDKWVKNRTPLGRWGKPQDFEGAAIFLASDASQFITGQIIYVDGGWLSTF